MAGNLILSIPLSIQEHGYGSRPGTAESGFRILCRPLLMAGFRTRLGSPCWLSFNQARNIRVGLPNPLPLFLNWWQPLQTRLLSSCWSSFETQQQQRISMDSQQAIKKLSSISNILFVAYSLFIFCYDLLRSWMNSEIKIWRSALVFQGIILHQETLKIVKTMPTFHPGKQLILREVALNGDCKIVTWIWLPSHHILA